MEAQCTADKVVLNTQLLACWSEAERKAGRLLHLMTRTQQWSSCSPSIAPRMGRPAVPDGSPSSEHLQDSCRERHTRSRSQRMAPSWGAEMLVS